MCKVNYERRIPTMTPTASLDAYQKKIKRVLITEEEIKAAIKETAKKLDALYDGRPLLIVCILKGSFVFASDLCRAITVPCEIDFMRVKSYNGTVSSGNIRVVMDLDRDVSEYHVVIAEDIIDTGKTLAELIKLLKSRNPLSLTLVSLLNKPSRREVEVHADYNLFTIPDHFVIGYGLDCAELYRNLPYIAEYNTEE